MIRVNSIETFGAVDGPGVRFVVFFQGCPMRCKYCHNPDTWDPHGGQEYSPEDIIAKMQRNISYYRTGGLTATGGEPMMQLEGLTELFTLAKEAGIHTCLDTSGIYFPADGITSDMEKLINVTDLVMLDIKHIDSEEAKKLTGFGNENAIAMARYLDGIGKPLWIRHVVVPGYTMDEGELRGVGEFMRTLGNIEKLEVLPYHSMGKVKYDNLGIDYCLKDVPQVTKEQAAWAENIIRNSWI